MDRTSAQAVPTQEDYERLLAFRTSLRRFLHLSEERAQAAGITPAQHQLLLAIRGHGQPHGPSIGEVADYLLIRHNSAVGLADRAEAAGLVRRDADPEHPGKVRLTLTDLGAEKLERLTVLALDELVRLAPSVEKFWIALKEQVVR